MDNLAGVEVDKATKKCREELELAGIEITEFGSPTNPDAEVQSRAIGGLPGWTFTRAWYYWVAKGRGLPLEYAVPLHEARGQEVRVEGHCGAPDPVEYLKGTPVDHYHIDSLIGLKALADAIKKSNADGIAKYGPKTPAGSPA